MCFAGVLTELDQLSVLGSLLIGLVVIMIIYNATVIYYDLCCFIKMLILRYRKKIPSRVSKLVVKKDKIVEKPVKKFCPNQIEI